MTLTKQYYLKKKNSDCIIEEITIQESAKEDFMELMGWSDSDFKKNTVLRFKK